MSRGTRHAMTAAAGGPRGEACAASVAADGAGPTVASASAGRPATVAAAAAAGSDTTIPASGEPQRASPGEARADESEAALGVTIAALGVYPVKSCAGFAPDAVRLVRTGFELDRAWMLVDADGEFVTQRELPRMALVRCEPKPPGLLLQAPGMPPLELAPGAAGAPVRVRVWDDTVAARDAGAAAARWFSDFLRQELRLVRFDPDQRRLSARAWTGTLEAENAFSDGFPLLVLSTASIQGLNARLAARGAAPVGAERFRPNLLLAGLDAHGEDVLDEIAFATPEGAVRLRLVKPCPRCPIPNVDPATGVAGREPLDTLAGYRADPRVGGGVSFGMNAVIVEGVGRVLRVGQAARATVRF